MLVVLPKGKHARRKCFSLLTFRDELHLCVCGPLATGFLLPIQLDDALPGEPLGVAFPEPVGNGSVAADRLPAVQKEILPQDLNQQIDLSFYSYCPYHD